MKTVLCFGDSNTHGTMPIVDYTDRSRLPRSKRWPDLLAASLPGVDVIAEGHPGRTTVHDDPIEGTHKNGLTALPAILESHRPLDLVILMLGTNDLKARFSVGPEDIARSVDRLLGTIAGSQSGRDGKAPSAFLVAPAPIREVGLLAPIFKGGAEKSRALAERLAVVADARGIPFLDAGPIAEVSPVDGVHLTEAGCAALAEALVPLVGDCLGLQDG